MNQLKTRLAEIAKRFGLVNARIDHAANKKGELVLAIIVPPSKPGEWSDDQKP